MSTAEDSPQAVEAESPDGGPPTQPPSKEDNESEIEGGNLTEDTGSGNVYDLDPSDDTGFRMGTEESVDPEVIKKLSQDFLQHFLPSLDRSKSSITEILSNQTVLIDTLEQENAKFGECTAHTELTAMMVKAKNYHNKLLTVKRDMASLHDKAGKLKRRALKLQQQKQKEELQRAHQQERELEKEHMLNARVARPDS